MSRRRSYAQQRDALGNASEEFGTLAASRTFGVHRGLARYWRKKVSDLEFHPGEWGGTKTFKLCQADREDLELRLWVLLRENNTVMRSISFSNDSNHVLVHCTGNEKAPFYRAV